MRKTFTLLATTGLAVPLVGSALAQTPATPPDYAFGPQMMWWGGGGWYGMLLGPLFMILAVVAVILLVRWLVAPSSSQHPQLQTPLDILKARFARGEIDKQEYEDRRRTIAE
jgi:putative membrane protein